MTARSLGLQVIPLEVRQPDEIFSYIESIKGHADALYVATDPLIFSNRIKINAIALNQRTPTIYGSREYVDAGALMSYGPNWTDLFMPRNRSTKFFAVEGRLTFPLSSRRNSI